MELIGGGVHRISGRVYLKGLFSELSIKSDVTLIDGGRIIGEGEWAAILIDAGFRLTSQITIEGTLVIDTAAGSVRGVFVNDGLVHANRFQSPFAITLDFVVVEGSGTFKVGPGSFSDRMVFSFLTAAGNLDATFDLRGGVLDVDTDIVTTGKLKFIDGQIQVAAGTVFMIP